MLMQDYLMRRGYAPVIMVGVERGDYIRMVSEVGDGEPGRFVKMVLMTRLDALRRFGGRGRTIPMMSCLRILSEVNR